MPADFSDQQAAQFEEDLQRARGYKPVTQKEMRQAYKQYEKVGLKFGNVKKRATDQQLYKKAEKTVLAWWKLQQKEKIERKKAQREARQERLRDPNRGAQSSWSGGSGGGGYTGGSGSGNYLPDTAMSDERGDRNRKKLPDIVDMNPRRVRAILREMGVPATWNPPPYAERSEAALRGWVQRQATRHDLVLRANGAKAYLNDAVVSRVAANVGFPVNPNSVPLRHRQTPREIRRYILMLKRSWEQAMANRENAMVDAGVSRTDAKESVRRTTSYQNKMGGFTP